MQFKISRTFPFIESVKAITADKQVGAFGKVNKVFKVKKGDINSYFDYYSRYDLLSAPIDDLVESAVGQGYYIIVDGEEEEIKNNKSKLLIDKFGEVHNYDMMLPNITRCMLIAGFCPVEVVITKTGPIDKRVAMKIIHPKTVTKIDEKDGVVRRVLQEVKNEKPQWIPKVYNEKGDTKLAWFVYRQVANDVRGNSLIYSLLEVFSILVKITSDINSIMDRYLSPLGIWKSARTIEAIKKAVENRDMGEDIFLGNLNNEEMEHLVEFISVNPNVPFWEYIEYLDRRLYSGARANNLWYSKQVSEASADKIDQIVMRHVTSIQRNLKRTTERDVFRRITESFGLDEVPRLIFGVEKTGVDDIQVEAFLAAGVRNGYIDRSQYLAILNQLGVKINVEEDVTSEDDDEDNDDGSVNGVDQDDEKDKL